MESLSSSSEYSETDHEEESGIFLSSDCIQIADEVNMGVNNLSLDETLQAYLESRLSWSLKNYVVIYSDAMQKHVEDVESFDDFLSKEEEARSQAREKLVQDFSERKSEICFCRYTIELEKLINTERTLFEKKILSKITHLVTAKMQQVLSKYDETMKASSEGICVENLRKAHQTASQVAEDELRTLPALTYDHNLWFKTRSQLADSISILQQHHFQKNQMLLTHKKTSDKLIAHTNIDACQIKVDMRKGGLLGRGGFGTVRIGFVEHYGFVALKVPHFHGSRSEIENAENKLIKEIDLLYHANHDNIVRVFGYTAWKESLAVVLEYMPSESLRALLMNKEEGQFVVPRIPDDLSLRFCTDISNGVSYLHHAFSDQRMVHGDLKPCNVLLTSDLRCKVSDFGGADIATCSEFHSSSSSKKRKSGEWTRGYIAPERLNDLQKRISKAMDVYSVGMIFFVVMRRQNPSQDVDRNAKEIRRYCQHFDPTKCTSAIVKALKRFILKCTDHDFQHRPNMLTIRNELQNLLCQQDSASIAQGVADVLRTYNCKNQTADISDFTSLANADFF